MEQISPELALIDPELRRADVARLAAQAVARPAADPVRRPNLSAAPPAPLSLAGWRSWQAGALKGILLLSLMANGVLVAIVAARGQSVGRPVLLTSSMLAEAAPTSSMLTGAAPVPARARTLDMAGAVERRILEMVVQSPGRRLPPSLIDRRTGLAKNNLQAVCHRTPPVVYLCIVRPARHNPGEGLYVRYRPRSDGRATVTWYGYRRG